MKRAIGKAALALSCVLLVLPMVSLPAAAATRPAGFVSTQEWDAGDIENVSVSYGSDKVYIGPSRTGQIVLKEYPKHGRSMHRAKTTNSNGKLTIQGGSPASSSQRVSSKIYLPDDFKGTVNVTTSKGRIEVSKVTSDAFTLKSTSGQIKLKNISGVVKATTERGNISVKNSAFSGSLTSDSGKVEFSADELTGDLSVYSRSGKTSAGLPKDGSFTLSASSGSGKVKNKFGSPFVYEGSQRELAGSYGSVPVHKVTLETDTADIKVSRH